MRQSRAQSSALGKLALCLLYLCLCVVPVLAEICANPKFKFKRGHTCGIHETTRSGECWGYNGDGQLNVPSESGPLQWAMISTGTKHTCGVTNMGGGHCWGKTGYVDPYTDVPYAVMPNIGADVWKEISAGHTHTCAITQLGDAHCWDLPGNINIGQIPAGSTKWKSISAGTSSTCAVNATGTGFCWGINKWGQNDVVPGKNWTMISAGEFHSCGVTVNHDIYCWGSAAFTSLSSMPDVAPMQWNSIAVGYEHTCGRTVAGLDYCWGPGGNYRTSLFGNTWKVMARGSFFECGVNSTGTGYCHRKGMPSGASHNDFCATMCHADLPQLLIYLNDYVLTTASVPVACQACCIADDAHSSWWR